MDKTHFDPRIIIDTREQTPLVFPNLPAQRGTLVTADYSLLGAEDLMGVERKTIPDIAACCGQERERFERELERLESYWFRRLLIVGNESDVRAHKYRSRISPASIIGSLAAWEIRYDIPVVWAATPDLAALAIEKWVRYFARELRLERERMRRNCVLYFLPGADGIPGPSEPCPEPVGFTGSSELNE